MNSNNAEVKIQLGPKLTRGLGAGSHPETGKRPLKKAKKRLKTHLRVLT